MAFIIQWTQTAQKDRENIFEYWNKNNGSKDYSRKLNHPIEEKIALTKMYPKAGLTTSRKGVRYHLIERHYKLFYKKDHNRIIILRLWDSRQDPGRLADLSYQR